MSDTFFSVSSFLPEFDLSKVLFACVEGSSDAVMLTNLKGIIFYVNPAWVNLYSYQSQEAVGKTPRLLRSGHHPTEFYEAMWKEILDAKKGHWKGEIINRTKDGREVPILLTINPFRDGKKEIAGYMSIAIDMSQRKKIENQMQWQDRLATVALLSSGLAHELGTPLGVIRGRAEYVLKTAQLNAPEKTSLETIVSQSDRVSSLMHSLLSLSQSSSGEMKGPVSLAKIAKEIGILLEGQFRADEILYDVAIPETARVIAEPTRMKQVLLNLVLNSLQAIHDRKELGVSAVHFIRMGAVKRDGYCGLSVSDSGGGIDPKHLPHLFKPFFTTKEVGVGTGLGLVTIHQFVQSWGGQISVDNHPGVGVTFTIDLPNAYCGELGETCDGKPSE